MRQASQHNNPLLRTSALHTSSTAPLIVIATSLSLIVVISKPAGHLLRVISVAGACTVALVIIVVIATFSTTTTSTTIRVIPTGITPRTLTFVSAFTVPAAARLASMGIPAAVAGRLCLATGGIS